MVVNESDALIAQGSHCSRLALLDGFELVIDGQVVPIVAGSQRLMAVLALSGEGMTRADVVATLWANKDRARGFANLRSAHWRLPREARDLVAVSGDRLMLNPAVECDVVELRQRIARLIAGDGDTDSDSLSVADLTANLLPSWYEDWIIAEREHIDQLRVRALEVLCELLTAQGRFGEAIEAGLTAVTSGPLRESAHKVLITAHLAEGNRSEARRHYELYEQLLYQELGVVPGPDLQRLVSGDHR
jgi:DNA-binding SARP family transcriptional activator